MPDAPLGADALDRQAPLVRLGLLPLSSLALGQVLQRIAELALTTVLGADEVSVTLLEGERARSVAFTGSLAVTLDERQYEDGFGPCMDAARTGEVIHLPDTSDHDRYASFSAACQRAGVRSTLSVGMPTTPRPLGGMNIYSRGSDPFTAESRQLATAFAEHASVALLNAAALDSKTALVGQLESAMASRATIEQAKGVLMGRLGCTADQAFAQLVAQSQKANRKLSAIAADVVAATQDGRSEG